MSYQMGRDVLNAPNVTPLATRIHNLALLPETTQALHTTIVSLRMNYVKTKTKQKNSLSVSQCNQKQFKEEDTYVHKTQMRSSDESTLLERVGIYKLVQFCRRYHLVDGICDVGTYNIASDHEFQDPQARRDAKHRSCH